MDFINKQLTLSFINHVFSHELGHFLRKMKENRFLGREEYLEKLERFYNTSGSSFSSLFFNDNVISQLVSSVFSKKEITGTVDKILV